MLTVPLPPFPQTINIFFSYASTSPKDKRLFETFMKHLSGLRRHYLTGQWHDSAISNAPYLTRDLETYLNEARIIIFLITADFLASTRCVELELNKALELAEMGSARLIPVLLLAVDWKTLPLSPYQPLPADGQAIGSKRDREAAFSEVASGIRKVVEELASQATKMLKRPTRPASPVYHFPYRQNDFFTDRDTILANIASFFATAPDHQISVIALYGLGGMGKTQIAQAYLQRSSRLYQSILWLNASSRETLSGEIGALFEKLALPKKETAEVDQLFADLKSWLQHQTSWLLVLDHLDDLALFKLMIPCSGSGHVLLTTRTRAVEDLATALPVVQFDTEASILFLLQRAEMLPTGTPSLAQAEPTSVQHATTIAQAMDGFPLALDQAGAYLAETGCGLANYIDLFQHKRAMLLSRRGRLAHGQGHAESVAVTLMLTIEKVKSQHSALLPLLHLLAFLHPEHIPYELLEEGASALNEPLRRLIGNRQIFYEVLGELHSHALIHHQADTTTLHIHRLVQAILIETLTARQQRQWASRVVRMVNHVFPDVRFESWPTCRRYLAQAQQCATLIQTFRLTLHEGAQLLQGLGSYCYHQAYYAEAETYLTQALHLQEQQPWSDAQETARTLNSLGLLYYKLARTQQAEEVHQRALALREQTLGANHPQTAESLNNLALLYSYEEKYQQAEQLYQRVLAIETREADSNNLDSAKTLHNLGVLFFKQGQYSRAEAAYQQALTIYEGALPPEHPHLRYPLDSLGELAEARGAYQRAAALYQRVLAICEQAFGDNHPETALSLNKLASIYEAENQDQQAEALYLRALNIGEQVWGAEHPDVALFLNNLAFLADKQGQLRQAEEYYQRSLRIYEQAEGTENTAVADILNNLGVLYRDSGDITYAESLLRRSLAIRQQKLGRTHPDTAQSLSNLAELLKLQHAYGEAEKLFQQAYTLRLQLLGSTHPQVIQTREKYAALLELQQKHEEAEQLRQTGLIKHEIPSRYIPASSEEEPLPNNGTLENS